MDYKFETLLEGWMGCLGRWAHCNSDIKPSPLIQGQLEGIEYVYATLIGVSNTMARNIFVQGAMQSKYAKDTGQGFDRLRDAVEGF